MALFPTPQESCFYLAPELTDTGLWRDLSPFGLHGTVGGGYAGPAYGITTGPSGAKYIACDGANDNGTLPLRFYTNAPTTAITVALVQWFNAPAADDRVFDCVNAGVTRGFAVDFSAAARLRIRAYDAAGAVKSCTLTADAPFVSRTRVVVLTMEPARSYAAAWVDRVQVAATFAGSTTPIAYDAAVVPTLFSIVGGAGNFNDGGVYALAVDDRVWSHAEAVAFCDYWRDRT
jgi:hypothetical protein